MPPDTNNNPLSWCCEFQIIALLFYLEFYLLFPEPLIGSNYLHLINTIPI